MSNTQLTQLPQLANSIRKVVDIKGMSLAVFGSLMAITGQILQSRMAVVFGISLFASGILSGGSQIVDQLSSSMAPATGYSLITVVVIASLGLFILSGSNFTINLLLFAGFALLISGVVSQEREPQPPRVEYRYIPRTFKEEQEEPVKVSEIFEDMFSKPNVWPISGYASNDSNFIGRRSLDQISRPFS